MLARYTRLCGRYHADSTNVTFVLWFWIGNSRLLSYLESDCASLSVLLWFTKSYEIKERAVHGTRMGVFGIQIVMAHCEWYDAKAWYEDHISSRALAAFKFCSWFFSIHMCVHIGTLSAEITSITTANTGAGSATQCRRNCTAFIGLCRSVHTSANTRRLST